MSLGGVVWRVVSHQCYHREHISEEVKRGLGVVANFDICREKYVSFSNDT